MFKGASKNGHTEATEELEECYLHGRVCERDLVKAAELGNSKAALELGLKMEKEGKKNECMRFLWMASDYGEVETITRLEEIYRSGKIASEDDMDSKRLYGVDIREAD